MQTIQSMSQTCMNCDGDFRIPGASGRMTEEANDMTNVEIIIVADVQPSHVAVSDCYITFITSTVCAPVIL